MAIKLIIGKSGSGKDTYIKNLMRSGVEPIVSYTTRPPREGEIDGVDYHFVSFDEFQHLIENDELTEYRTYDTLVGGKKDTWYYGTPRLNPQKEYIGVVTPEGVSAFIDVYENKYLNVIYMEVDDEVRKRRAMKRGSFDETEWNRRVIADNLDFAPEKINALEKKLGKPLVRLDNNKEKQHL